MFEVASVAAMAARNTRRIATITRAILVGNHKRLFGRSYFVGMGDAALVRAHAVQVFERDCIGKPARGATDALYGTAS